MSTWYVRKTGNDTTGDGSSGNPYLTIGKAVTVASAYDTIDVGAGTYDEAVLVNTKSGLRFVGVGNDSTSGTIVTGAGGDAAFYGTTASDVTIEDMHLSGTVRNGVDIEYGDGWLLEDLVIRNFGRNVTTGYYHGVRVGHSSTNRANDCIIRRCQIYDIFSPTYGEGYGILSRQANRTIIEYCDIYLVRKEGIRIADGDDCEIRYNTVHACWGGITWNANTTGTYFHHNHVWHCCRGANPKHSVGTAAKYLRMNYNTIEYCSDSALRLGGSAPVGDYWEFKYNLLRAPKNAFVFVESEDIGTHIVINYNCYHKIGSAPDYYYRDQFPVPDETYATLAEVQAADPYANYETNGKDYVEGDEATYGSGELHRTGLTWSPHTATCIGQSSGTGSNLADHDFTTHWIATSEVAYADFDLGSSLSWTRLVFQPAEDNASYNPTSVEVYRSDNGTSWTLVQAFTTDEDGPQQILKFTTRQTARYFRFKVLSTYGHANARLPDLEVGILRVNFLPVGASANITLPSIQASGVFTRTPQGALIAEGATTLPSIQASGVFTRIPATAAFGGAATISQDDVIGIEGGRPIVSTAYVPGRDRTSREIRDSSARLSSGLRYVDRAWTDVNHELVSSASIATAYTVASVFVPAPPEGWAVLLEGWTNLSWPSGSALDAIVAIETGSAQIATAKAVMPLGSGSQSVRLSAIWKQRENVTARVTVVTNTGRSTVDVMNSGIVGRYVRIQ